MTPFKKVPVVKTIFFARSSFPEFKTTPIMSTYLIALFKQKPFLVTKEEGYFIRKFRWSVIRKKYLEF